MRISMINIVIMGMVLTVSCTHLPTEQIHERPEQQPAAGLSSTAIPEKPEKPEPPSIPFAIMGIGRVSPELLGSFLIQANPQAREADVLRLARIYTEEAAIEQVNHDIAFIQMCLETGFLRFGGLVSADMHNYCGLGSIGPGQPGERFPDARTGVRAHIQHLKAYASEDPLEQELVNPRYRFVKRGSAPTFHDLTGRWAMDREYGNKLQSLLERLYLHAFDS